MGTPGSTGVEVWQDHIQANQPPQDTTIQFRPNGPFMVSTTEYTPQGNVTCTFNPAIPAPTWPPATGDSFTSSGNCGQFSIQIQGKITGNRAFQLDGRSYQTWVIDSTLTTHGQINATGTQEDWYSTDLRLPLYQSVTTKGTYGIISFSSQLTTRITSL